MPCRLGDRRQGRVAARGAFVLALGKEPPHRRTPTPVPGITGKSFHRQTSSLSLSRPSPGLSTPTSPRKSARRRRKLRQNQLDSTVIAIAAPRPCSRYQAVADRRASEFHRGGGMCVTRAVPGPPPPPTRRRQFCFFALCILLLAYTPWPSRVPRNIPIAACPFPVLP